jgi:hypothetical protein
MKAMTMLVILSREGPLGNLRCRNNHSAILPTARTRGPRRHTGVSRTDDFDLRFQMESLYLISRTTLCAERKSLAFM